MLRLVVSLIVVACFGSGICQAGTKLATFNVTIGTNNFAGAALFDWDTNGILKLTVTNNSTNTSVSNGGVMSAFFFDAKKGGIDISLTNPSAAVAAGSNLFNGSFPAGYGNLGYYWATRTVGDSPLTGFYEGQKNGVSSTGLSGAPGDTSLFGTPHMILSGGPDPLNGVDYGIVGPGLTLAGAPTQKPLIQSSAYFEFTASGLLSTDQLDFSKLRWQYGSSYSGGDGPNNGGFVEFSAVPVPSSVVLFSIGAIPLLVGRVVRNRRNHKAIASV